MIKITKQVLLKKQKSKFLFIEITITHGKLRKFRASFQRFRKGNRKRKLSFPNFSIFFSDDSFFKITKFLKYDKHVPLKIAEMVYSAEV